MLKTCEGLLFVQDTCSTVEPQRRIINASMFLSRPQLWLFSRNAFTLCSNCQELQQSEYVTVEVAVHFKLL